MAQTTKSFLQSSTYCGSRLNRGYTGKREISLFPHIRFAVLSRRHPNQKKFDITRRIFEPESYLDRVRSLVHAIHRKRA
jgi:hypothetical protein